MTAAVSATTRGSDKLVQIRLISLTAMRKFFFVHDRFEFHLTARFSWALPREDRDRVAPAFSATRGRYGTLMLVDPDFRQAS